MGPVPFLAQLFVMQDFVCLHVEKVDILLWHVDLQNARPKRLVDVVLYLFLSQGLFPPICRGRSPRPYFLLRL